MKMKTVITVAAAGLLIAGCGQKDGSQADNSTVPVPAAFSAALPETAPVSITEAKAKLKPGDDVVLSGLIMGSKHPFVEGRAAFMLVDDNVISPCSDHCPTPWDACCDTPEDRIKAAATIMVIGEDGKVLPHGLRGVGGLRELSRVTVGGKVAAGSTTEAFVINANALKVTN